MEFTDDELKALMLAMRRQELELEALDLNHEISFGLVQLSPEQDRKVRAQLKETRAMIKKLSAEWRRRHAEKQKETPPASRVPG